MNKIDLRNSENKTVTLKTNSKAVFDNTVGFYEINGDGSVFDSQSNNNIAPGEDGYTEAALANRLDVSLSSPDRTQTEVVTELEGGKIYGSFIVADGTIEDLIDGSTEGDPDIFFSITEANFDGIEHVKEVGENILGFEDLVNGGDLDFDDMTVEFSGLDLSSDTPEVPDTPDFPDTPDVNDPTASPFGEGKEIRIESFGPTRNDLLNSVDVEINSEKVEFDGFFSFSGERADDTIDISGVSENRGSIVYDFSDTASPTTLPESDFFGDVFTDFSNTIAPIENVSIDSSASNLGIDSSAISFSENSIEVNFAGVSLDSSSVLELDVEFGDV